ncbi:MAG: S8 family peptidase [Clostridiales bacterium]|nr:S8 family peptidase [Clostridiales bacterium]
MSGGKTEKNVSAAQTDAEREESTGGISPAQDPEFGDFIVQYGQNLKGETEVSPNSFFQDINGVYGILYVPLEEVGEPEINSYSYDALPKCYACMDVEAAAASGVTRLHEHPYLKLRGKGTAVAVADTGIDYRNPLFRDRLGSRIAFLWDQTLEGEPGGDVPFGRVFTKEDIDRALAEEEPLEAVPSVDENGHGTALAGIAAGNTDEGNQFTGAAPEATLLVVKLKQAKAWLRDFYLYPREAVVFQEDDVMLAVAWAVRRARELSMPLSLCLGIGSSQGAHMGKSPLSQYLDSVAGFSQTAVSVAAGNEGSTRNHFLGSFHETREAVTAELRVGEEEPGFTLEMWGQPPEVYGVSIQSPTGETLDVSSSLGSGTQTLSFVFVETKVLVNYVLVHGQTGNVLVYFRFLHPAPGIWKIHVRTRYRQEVHCHMWLPVEGLISPDTYFLEPSPYNTVTSPGDASGCMTVTAYQPRDGSLFYRDSRGYTPEGTVTPHLAAPGAGISVPMGNGTFGVMSGTSLAAAQAAGVSALLFQWAVQRENMPFLTGNSIRYYLQRGARREENVQYPNPEWGYGKIDLYHTFELLS